MEGNVSSCDNVPNGLQCHILFFPIEYKKGTYKELGAAIALTLAVGGATPFFFSSLTAKTICDGPQYYRSRPLDRQKCYERGYITAVWSENITRVSTVPKNIRNFGERT